MLLLDFPLYHATFPLYHATFYLNTDDSFMSQSLESLLKLSLL